MEILEFTEINPVMFRSRIKVYADAILKAYEEVLINLTNSANIKGFRPGKAPKHVVQRHHGIDRIWQMARDKSSEQALDDALQQKELVAATVPVYQHTDYSGEGDYEFTVTFYTQPPSPHDVLRHAIKRNGDTPNPEDHLPMAMRKPGDTFGGLNPGPLAGIDHNHMLPSGGNPQVPDHDIIKYSSNPVDNINHEGVDPNILTGVSSLPGSPQMFPNLPGNIPEFTYNQTDIGKVPSILDIVPEDDIKESDIPDLDSEDKPGKSKSFKISEDI